MIETLLDSAWIKRLSSYNVLYVGFSGGLDSTVLLHCLTSEPTLLAKIHAVHIHHGLSPHALEWERHCEQLCTSWSIPLSVHRVTLSNTHNVEENARVARYAVFHSLLTQADALLLAHHQDDQAETLLLNLLRGAGVDGLAAMEEIQSLAQGDLLRPLLSYSRKALESYARHYHLSWVDDESNQDERFSRNFIRHRLMPLLQEKWPQAARSMARSARHCQDASKNLEVLAKIDCTELALQTNQLSIASIKQLPRERALNSLRVWLKHNGHQRPSEKTLNRLIDEVVFARIDAVPVVSFGKVSVRRYRDHLYCLRKTIHMSSRACEGSPDCGIVPNFGDPSQARYDVGHERLRLKKVTQTVAWFNFPNPLNLDALIGTLYAEASIEGFNVPLSGRIEVRFRKGGEQLRLNWQTKTLKHLLQQWQVPPWERDVIPLLYVDDELAVVVGYAVSDDFYATDQHNTYTVGFV